MTQRPNTPRSVLWWALPNRFLIRLWPPHLQFTRPYPADFFLHSTQLSYLAFIHKTATSLHYLYITQRLHSQFSRPLLVFGCWYRRHRK